MRVSQIQNLTWIGNVAVLAGLVWVGLQFWDVRKAKASPELAWPKAKMENDPGKSRWPGDIKDFEQIWKTPINGKVPPPPEKPNTAPVKVDRVAEFKGKIKNVTGFEFPTQPEKSTARLNYEGKDVSISPGSSLGDFQLIQFSFVTTAKPGADPVTMARLVFTDPENGKPVTVEQIPQQGTPLMDRNVVPFKPTMGNGVSPGRIDETHIGQKAWCDPDTGDYVIPEDEQVWVEVWGEKNVWSKLATKPDADAEGKSHGQRIMSPLEAGTPLAASHGIGQGDIIRSINSVPMTSKEDVANYLRGDGKGLDKYNVVVETDGKQRTVVYRVPRHRSVSRD